MPGKRSMSGISYGEQGVFRDLGRDDDEGTSKAIEKSQALAIDPGKTTGWAAWTRSTGYVVGEVATDEVWPLLDDLGLSVHNIVYERFDYRTGQPYADLTPVEVIGVIKEWYRQHRLIWIGKLIKQRPIDKFFFTNERIKERKLWTPGKPHAMDALRHLLYFQKKFV